MDQLAAKTAWARLGYRHGHTQRLALAAIVLASTSIGFANRGAAQLAPPLRSGAQSAAHVEASRQATASVEAELGGDHKGALSAADEAVRADGDDPWAHYVRGDALVSLARTDEALRAFQEAEARSDSDDPWGKSVAIWGQAHALTEGYRCKEASPIFERYAVFVQSRDALAAAMAREYAKQQCTKPGPPTYSQNEVEAIDAGIGGNFQRSLELADTAVAANGNDARALYLRGVALLGLRRFDDAVASFRAAEQHSPAAERHDKSLAIWGQANALKEAGRCSEASPIYERYAALVQSFDPAGAAMGRQYAQKKCVPIHASQ